MRSYLALVVACALSACVNGTLPNGGGGNLLTNLMNASVADLQAADKDALSHNDKLASMCYEGLIPLVQNLPSPGPAPVGVASVFQKGRDLVVATGEGTSLPQVQGFEAACGGLVLDVNNMVAGKLAGKLIP